MRGEEGQERGRRGKGMNGQARVGNIGVGYMGGEAGKGNTGVIGELEGTNKRLAHSTTGMQSLAVIAAAATPPLPGLQSKVRTLNEALGEKPYPTPTSASRPSPSFALPSPCPTLPVSGAAVPGANTERGSGGDAPALAQARSSRTLGRRS